MSRRKYFTKAQKYNPGKKVSQLIIIPPTVSAINSLNWEKFIFSTEQYDPIKDLPDDGIERTPISHPEWFGPPRTNEIAFEAVGFTGVRFDVESEDSQHTKKGDTSIHIQATYVRNTVVPAGVILDTLFKGTIIFPDVPKE